MANEQVKLTPLQKKLYDSLKEETEDGKYCWAELHREEVRSAKVLERNN